MGFDYIGCERFWELLRYSRMNEFEVWNTKRIEKKKRFFVLGLVALLVG
jgi:hypothetical protein